MDNNPTFELELPEKTPNNSLEEIVSNLGLDQEFEKQANSPTLPHDFTPPNDHTLPSLPTPDYTSTESDATPQSPIPNNDSTSLSFPTIRKILVPDRAP